MCASLMSCGNSDVTETPDKNEKISIPELPLELSAYSFGEIIRTVEISEITPTYEDDEIILTFKCSMIYNQDGESEAVKGRFHYYLNDKDGNRVESGTIFTKKLTVGETGYAEKIFDVSKLDLSQNYELVLMDEK